MPLASPVIVIAEGHSTFEVELGADALPQALAIAEALEPAL